MLTEKEGCWFVSVAPFAFLGNRRQADCRACRVFFLIGSCSGEYPGEARTLMTPDLFISLCEGDILKKEEWVMTSVELLYMKVFVPIFWRAKVAEMTTAAQPVAAWAEHDLLEKEGWTLEKTVKITGIQRWRLTRCSDVADRYFPATSPSLLSEEPAGQYQTDPLWNWKIPKQRKGTE